MHCGMSLEEECFYEELKSEWNMHSVDDLAVWQLDVWVGMLKCDVLIWRLLCWLEELEW